MLTQSQERFLDDIRADYLYNFSLYLNQPLIGPEMLQIIITTRCNLKCKMCEVWKQKEKEANTYHIKRAIDDAVQLGNLKEVYFTGGEALLREDIFALVKYVKDYYPHIRTHLNTNGTLFTPGIFRRIIHCGLDSIGISIDSPIPEIHNSLRGEGVFEKAMSAIEYINKEKKRLGLNRPEIDTLSVLMDQTLESMPDMIDFCLKYNLLGLNIQPYVHNGDLRSAAKSDFWIKKERLPLLREVLEDIVCRHKKVKDKLFLAIEPEKIYNYFSKPVYVDKCYAGFTRALLVGNKFCFVCNGPNDKTTQHFGEVDKDSLLEVWFSPAANYFRETIKKCKKNCVQFCSIRPSSDDIYDIHRRVVEKNEILLLKYELKFLEHYKNKYPELPLDDIILDDIAKINKSTITDANDSAIKKNLEKRAYHLEERKDNSPDSTHNKRENISVAKDLVCRVYDNIKSSTLYPYCIDIVVNNYCNLKCLYCSSRNIREGKNLDGKVIMNVLEDAYKMNVKEISITSLVGEPLIYPWIKDVMRQIKQKGFKGSLLTNGSVLDIEFAHFLRDISWDIIIISIDSFIEDIQYTLRPAANREMYMQGVKEFLREVSQNNWGLSINLNMVVTTINYRQVLNYFQSAKEYGVSNITFLRLIKMTEEYNTLCLSEKQEEEFINLLGKNKLDINYNKYEWLQTKSNIESKNQADRKCYYHLYKVIVDCDGKILKCNGDSKETGFDLSHDSIFSCYSKLVNKYRHLRNNPYCWDMCCSPIKRINQDIMYALKNNTLEC
jgi:MoaA/NifB/PqqE/SkfB family radical SAM enzyme